MFEIGGQGVVRFESTKAWGVGPASASGAVAGDPAMQVGDYVAISYSGVSFAGICVTIRSTTTKQDGTLYEFDLLDNRIRLQWQVVFGAWNMETPNFGEANRVVPDADGNQYSSNSDPLSGDDLSLDDDVSLDADEINLEDLSLVEPDANIRRRFYHILPNQFKNLIRTYTDDPLTAKDVLNSAMGGAWGDYGFIRQFHSSMSSDPVYAIDALNGATIASLISDINSRMGLDMYLQSTRTLVWDRKGSGSFTVPALPTGGSAGGCLMQSGESLATWPTRIMVVGDRSLVQVPDIELEPDWAEGWEDFIDELKWVREVGEVLGITGSSAEEVAERNARAKEITVQEYIQRKGADLAEFGDRGSWGKISRMDLPAWIYLTEIVFRSYRLPRDYEYQGIPLSSLEIHSGLLCAMEVENGGDTSMKYRAEPIEFYPATEAYVTAKGVPLDLVDLKSIDQFVADRSEGLGQKWVAMNDFRLDPWHGSVVFRNPVFKDGDSGAGKSFYLQPNRGEGGYRDNATFASGTDFDKVRVLNPLFEPEAAEVRACFVFKVGKWTKSYGTGPRRAPHYVRNLSQHFLEEAQDVGEGVGPPGGNPFGGGAANLMEVLYQSGQNCEEISDLLADSVVQRDAAIESGNYLVHGVAGYELNSAVDRVTTRFTKREGVTEIIDLLKERGTESFVAEHELEARRQQQEAFQGQRALQQEIADIRELGKLEARARETSQGRSPVRTINEAGYRAVGDEEVSPLMIEDGDGKGPEDSGSAWKAGDIVWLNKEGAPDAKSVRFGGVVMGSVEAGSKKILHTATRGVVPVKVEGPFPPNAMVGVEYGKSVAKVGGDRPLGRLIHSKGFHEEEEIVALVRLTGVTEHCPGFTPILIQKEDGPCIGVKPGWVVYHEPMAATAHDGLTKSKKAMPTLGGVDLDDDDPPCEELGAGRYKMIMFLSRYKARIEFLVESGIPSDPVEGERMVELAEFTVEADGEGDIVGISLIEQFVEAPFVDWAQGAACFEVVAWPKTVGYEACILGGDYHDSGLGIEGSVIFDGDEIYEAETFDVNNGDKIWAEWDVDIYGIGLGPPVVQVGPNPRPMTPHQPPCGDFLGEPGQYTKIIAEINASQGIVWVKQRHTGTIWITPDRTCNLSTEPPEESDESDDSSSEPIDYPDPEYQVIIRCVQPPPPVENSDDEPAPVPDPVEIPVTIPLDQIPSDGCAYFTICVCETEDGYGFGLKRESTTENRKDAYDLPHTVVIDGVTYEIVSEGGDYKYRSVVESGIPKYIYWDSETGCWVWSDGLGWDGPKTEDDPTGPYTPKDPASDDPDWIIVTDPNAPTIASDCGDLPAIVEIDGHKFYLDTETCTYATSSEDTDFWDATLRYESGRWIVDEGSVGDDWFGGTDPDDPTGIYIYPGDDGILEKEIVVIDPANAESEYDPLAIELSDSARRLVSPYGHQVVIDDADDDGNNNGIFVGEGPQGQTVIVAKNGDNDWVIIVDGTEHGKMSPTPGDADNPNGDYGNGWSIGW